MGVVGLAVAVVSASVLSGPPGLPVAAASAEFTGTLPAGDAPVGVRISPDGAKAYVANFISNNVTVYDTMTGGSTSFPVGAARNPFGVFVHPDGTRLFVTNNSQGSVTVYDAVTTSPIATVGVGQSPRNIAFTPDGLRAYVTNNKSGSVSVIDTVTLTVVATINVGTDPAGVDITPDGSRAYVSLMGDQAVVVIDTATNTVTDTIAGVGVAPGLALSPDGTRAYVSDYFGGNVRVIDTVTNSVIQVIGVGGRPYGVGVSPNNARVYTVDNSSSGRLVGIDPATNAVVEAFPVGSEPSDVAVTPNGAAVYVTNTASDTVTVLAGAMPVDRDPCTTAPAPPAGCWHFDETSGTRAEDSSANDNDGTYVNGPLLGVPGVFNTAVSMDGADDHVTVPDSPSLDVGDSFSLEGWIRRDDDGHIHQMFNKGGRGFHLVVMDRSNGNQVWLRKAGSSTIVRSTGGPGVPADGRFHHVVATKDGPHSAQLYIDGVQQALQQVSPAQVIQDTAFGLFFSSTPSGNPVAGDLDEYAVFDRALIPAEVTARHAALAPATDPGARASEDSVALEQTHLAERSQAARRSRMVEWQRTARRSHTAGQERMTPSGVSRSAAAIGTVVTCGDAGKPDSGLTGIEVAGLPCATATALALAGPRDVEAAGFSCAVTGEDFSGPVVRIDRECTGLLGQSLRYTTLS